MKTIIPPKDVVFEVRGNLSELSSVKEILEGSKDLYENCSNPHKVKSDGSEYFITISCTFVVYDTVIALIS
ncbi:MAG: hypothetical protein WCW54_00065 [Candidatus Paceibacterota bacterium]